VPGRKNGARRAAPISSKFFHRRVASAITVKSLFGSVAGKRKPLGCHFALDDLKIFISRSLDNFQKCPALLAYFIFVGSRYHRWLPLDVC
jgi:hypothetical protein